MKTDDFRATLMTVFEPSLSLHGYEYYLPSSISDGTWFCKKKDFGGKIAHIVIDIQTNSPTKENGIYRFAINLTRNEYDVDAKEYGYSLSNDLHLYCRLASIIWMSNRENLLWESDHWWHFTNENELISACQDSLSQLLIYGIPWLESIHSKQPI